jgi:hypothetical protein
VQYLNYLHTTVQFDVSPEAQADFAPVLGFFRHSLSESPDNDPQFVLSVAPRGDVCLDPRRTEEVDIRRSSVPEFTFSASRVREKEAVLYTNENATVRLPRHLRSVRNRVEVGMTGNAIIQVIDLIRDLVTRHEEACGTIILHASAVVYGDEVVAIAGSKGAGKTTTLLRLLAGQEASYFTGDKLFCWSKGGRLWALPWRDWPYVGVGTLRTSPQLSAFAERSLDLDLDGQPAELKLLLDPDQFEQLIGAKFDVRERPIGAVVLPRISPGRRTTTFRVTDPGERLARMLQLIDRSCDTSYFAWQSLLIPDYSRVYASVAAAREVLSGLQMVRVEGELDVAVEDLVDTG